MIGRVINMTITYEVGNGLYVNTTNRCSNSCDFCVRSTAEEFYGDLWLEKEPSRWKILDNILSRDLKKYSEIVFCGYGEPMYRFDDISWICQKLRENIDIKIRVNTNGQGNLINGRDITPELAGVFDCVSISLNAANAENYQKVCHSIFNEEAYAAIIDFAKKAKVYVDDVVLTVVEGTMSDEDISTCRAIAESIGVRLRVREFISN